MPYLSLHGITKTYPGTDHPSVADFNLHVEEGEFISLLGPSGCGKTTTLRMIAGLIEPSAGRIQLDGTELTRTPVHKRDMGMVFQSYALFPHLDVKQNVAFGLQTRKVSKAETSKKVEAVLKLVQLGHLANRRIKQLSGGQQQRVALARALVVEPKVLLLDEPLSNLDAKLRETMRDEIRSIQQKVGITTIFVTHDQDEALATSDRIVVMSQGNIEQIGRPQEVYEHPANRFVATFIGRANLLAAQITSTTGGNAVVQIPGIGAMPALDDHGQIGNGTVMIRPHRIRIERVVGTDQHGEVRNVIYVGDAVEYSVGIAGNLIQVQTVSSMSGPMPVGTPVRVGWDPHDAVVLPTDEVA